MRADAPAALQALQDWSGNGDGQNGLRPASLLGRALLRGMLAEVTRSSPDQWRFSAPSSGAPIALHDGGRPAPAISISHSGSWIAFAAAFAGAVGIDIEEGREGRDHSGIAEHAFGPRERDAARLLGPSRFYAIWTLREAIAKATGRGLEMAADGRDRVADGPIQSSQWVRLEDRDWWLMQESPAPNVSLALAFRPADDQREVRLQWWPGKG